MDQINKLENEIEVLRRALRTKENELLEIRNKFMPLSKTVQQRYDSQYQPSLSTAKVEMGDKLPRWAIERYSRQILLPDIGVMGQEKLCSAKVLIVGAGGLGCPAALYLAGAGVGHIGIVDYDTVDLTNIHRQILHREIDQSTSKVESAAETLKKINSHIKITAHNIQIDSSNALDLVSNYDIVLDCSDNVPTRYLLNDACVLSKLTLISGSALKMEGQITVYGYRAKMNLNEKDPTYGGPCYRCLFPTPPPAETVGSCSANGVAGPVPGVIGCLQALEAIKYLVGHTHKKLLVERMLLFDGEDVTFRTVKLRPKNAQCEACSQNATIVQLLDYESFCKAKAKEKKKEEARLKSQRRIEEKEKRMTGQRYFGFRKTEIPECDKRKWVQDVPKSERKMGPPCKSDFCAKGTARHCTQFSEEKRQKIFLNFWNELDWNEKKRFVRSLVETIPPKRRRLKHKGEISRKGDSKLYHLMDDDQKLPVCRVTFLNTLGVKEAMVRCWLVKEERPKEPKKPIKALNVDYYIDSLPKSPPKCQYCRNMSTKMYISIDSIKNQYQLYNLYVKEMKSKGLNPASRKTFSKVFASKDIKIFKPKNENDICDLISQHNVLPSIDTYQKTMIDLNNVNNLIAVRPNNLNTCNLRCVNISDVNMSNISNVNTSNIGNTESANISINVSNVNVNQNLSYIQWQ